MTAPQITQRDRAAAAVPLRLLAAAGLTVVGFAGIAPSGSTGVWVGADKILDSTGRDVGTALVQWADDGTSVSVVWCGEPGRWEWRRFAMAVDDDGFVTIVRLNTDEVVAELRGES